ncbi:MAG TPA: helix-turn-helix domain-containing protein [Jiangellaceae bacterium]|nr:helix-turn-helix domain-containing protein [Jiangellaceae bacterium]
MAGPDTEPPGPTGPGREAMLTLAEAGKILKLSRVSVWRRVCAGQIPASDVGNGRKVALRIKEADLWAYIDARQVA